MNAITIGCENTRRWATKALNKLRMSITQNLQVECAAKPDHPRFPLIDRNPQTFVETIYEARQADFKPARHRLYSDSVIELTTLP